jgi:hypothetical protein
MNQHADFLERYRRLSEWELAEIHARASALTEEARMALASVAAERGIDFPRLHQEERDEQSQLAEAEQNRDEKRNVRSALLFKVMAIIVVPVVALGMLFRPEQTYQTFISVLVQGIGIAVIAWIVLRFKGARRNRKQ